MTTAHSYLPEGLPIPVPEPDGLSEPHWSGLRRGEFFIQRCRKCGTWLWGPEWICHKCHSFDLAWTKVEPEGRIFSWTRVWHPTHAVLNDRGPYIVVVVELPHAGNVRVIGNLVGDAKQPERRVRAARQGRPSLRAAALASIRRLMPKEAGGGPDRSGHRPCFAIS
jgi:uncharacterized OB-fold protein